MGNYLEQEGCFGVRPGRRYVGLMYYIIAVFVIAWLFVDIAKAEKIKRVIVFNSYHPTYSWAKETIKGIETTFADYDPSIELDIEYMDTRRVKDEKHYENLYNLYKHKNMHYGTAGRRYDVIIACDDAALLFMLKHRAEIPNNPVVFCGINFDGDEIDSLLEGFHSITGILEVNKYESTLEMALRNHPGARQIVVVNDERASYYNQRKPDIEEAIVLFSDRVEFIELSLWEMSSDAALETIKSLGDESIVFLPSGPANPRGNLYPLAEGIITLQQHCKVPIYTISKEWVDIGLAAGGDISGAFYQGKIAVEMAIRILNGERADDIPIMKKGKSVFMFDYKRLKEFGISPSNLPKNSIILNKPQSFYYKYKTQIYIVAAIIATLTAIVIILSVNTVYRRLVERKVRHLAMIVEQAGEGIALSDLDGILQYINTAWARMHGYETAKELVGKHLSIFHTDEQMQTDVIPFNELAIQAGYHTGEVRHTRKDGTTFPTEMITTIFKDEKGKPAGFIGFATDITERKRAEQTLKEKQRLNELLLDSLPHFAMLIRKDKTILATNHLSRKMGAKTGGYCWMDFGGSEFIPQKDKEYINKHNEVPHDGTHCYFCLADEALENHKVANDSEIRIWDKILDTYWVPLGEDIFLHYAIDVTDRKRAEQELQKAYDQLETRVEKRTAELANANEKLIAEIEGRKEVERKLLDYQHQLRSLTSELSLSEERLRHQIAVGVHDYIGQNLAISKIKMESLAQSLHSSEFAATINEVVQLLSSTIESTRSLAFELSPSVLYELGFEAAIEWLVRQTRERDNLNISFENDHQPKPLSENVRVILFQGVRELLINVIKHANAQNIKVAAKKVDGKIKVSVEDDGIGFDAAQTQQRDYKSSGFCLFSIQERLGYIGVLSILIRLRVKAAK